MSKFTNPDYQNGCNDQPDPKELILEDGLNYELLLKEAPRPAPDLEPAWLWNDGFEHT